MKIRIERSELPQNEIVIKCGPDADAGAILKAVEEALAHSAALPLKLGGIDCFVKPCDILFFETSGDRTVAHTASAMYNTSRKLYELEEMLPRTFVRVSRSCIVNSAHVDSVDRSFTGPSRIGFRSTYKKAYASRKYCKSLMDILKETR
ncbi:MAG: LytTR family transcriptional regulator DNA-binding domain-containing protein [Clostridia bacterium]|nr:LytTR family transcriptional regulator DNA-binding domain-containing protein [Clostridia bacterium]